MLPMPTQCGRSHPPPRGTLQTVVEGGIPRGVVENPFTDEALTFSVRYCTPYVAHGGDPTGIGMDCPSPNYKRDHHNTGNQPTR